MDSFKKDRLVKIVDFSMKNAETGDEKDFIVALNKADGGIVLVEPTAKCESDHIHFKGVNEFLAFAMALQELTPGIAERVEKAMKRPKLTQALVDIFKRTNHGATKVSDNN